MKLPHLATIAALVFTLPLHAGPRSWTNADDGRAIQGEFVSQDETSVTIRRGDRKEVTIPLAQLHADDRTWLNANHPLPGTEPAAPGAVFDQLAFGDTRAVVIEKLKASKFVESTVEETFFGRTGLNGVFRTRKKIGGLDAMLFFDWDAGGRLKEITLHTAPLAANALDDQLVPCWNEFIELLTTLHGRPFNAQPKLEIRTLEDGGMIGTHLWKLDHAGTAMLGASREGDGYQVAVRFTTEDIKPVIIPAGSQSFGQSP